MSALITKLAGILGVETEEEFETVEDAKEEKVLNINNARARKQQPRFNSYAVEICSMSPKSYAEVERIRNAIKSRQIINLNLSKLDRSIARRIIDFTSGAASIADAEISTIGDQVYQVTPREVKHINELVEDYNDSDVVNLESAFEEEVAEKIAK